MIHRPDTPRPWINFLSNGEYCAVISQAAGGYSFYLDPACHRITRWAPANYLSDRPGRYLYIKDAASGEVFSGNYAPCGKGDRFECRHGMGYTRIKHRHNSIQTISTFFVPAGERLEVWIFEVKNMSRQDRRLRLFPFVEWHLGLWEPELHLRNLTVLMNEGVFKDRMQAVWAGKFPWGNQPWLFHAFLGSSLPVLGHDLDLESFVGAESDYARPRALAAGGCTNSRVRGANMVGVLEHEVALSPGETASFSVVVGLAENEAEAEDKLAEYRNWDACDKSLRAVKRQWRGLTDRISVETPDPQLNEFVNVWLKYQVLMNNHWGRSTSYYHEGHGEFGYRNTAQDAWAVVSMDPDYARTRILMLARHQRNSGQPLAGWSLVLGPSEGKAPADFPIWLPLLLSSYVKETGDLRILDKPVPYYDGGSDTVYRHAVKAMQFLNSRARSVRGLPLMGTQDWNDAFDRTGIGGKGESVWLGMGMCVGLKLLRELAELMNDDAAARECSERYTTMKALINQYAWAGDRYVYAFNDKGEPIGSPVNREGSCQLNSLTWAILAGIPNKEQARKLLHHIDHTLATPFGPVLFTPPYTEYNADIGRITAFAPGTKENASIFTHAGCFKVFMDYSLGRGDVAYETIRQMLPNSPDRDIDVYKAEPYVLPEYVVGPGNPRYGEGAFTWLTGSADWLLVSITQQLLGAQPTFRGLKIDPCLPSSWTRARLTRRFRGTRYDIRISNPDGVVSGVKEVTVDGIKVTDEVLPLFKDHGVHIVEVLMGKKGSERGEENE